jgi:hypothetical protein
LGPGPKAIQRPFLAPTRPASGPDSEKNFWTAQINLIFEVFMYCSCVQMNLESHQS